MKHAANFGKPEIVFIIGSGESGKVVLAFQESGHLENSLFVQGIRIVINVAVLEWRTDLRPVNTVFVSLGDALKAWMKIRCDFRDLEYSNVGRQQAVHGFA